jgi:hypothetical protein
MRQGPVADLPSRFGLVIWWPYRRWPSEAFGNAVFEVSVSPDLGSSVMLDLRSIMRAHQHAGGLKRR